ncbi:MAG TPA: EAL domain-containing protein [Acetobacteraceae bacterium]|nr:EAL domain-containing protein [Acetobacteraceae bacterium]
MAAEDQQRETRLLLVSGDPALIEAGRGAARALGGRLFVLPALDPALAWLLHPHPSCTHLLLPAGTSPADMDTLAGMLDEITDGAGTVLLLGPGPPPDRLAIRVNPPTEANIIAAVRAGRPRPTGQPLDATTLRAALHQGRLRMHFQPVLEARSLRLLGVEALARLHHPTLGIIRPSDFMPLAIASAQERTVSNVAAARSIMELGGEPFMQDRHVAFNMPLPGFLHESAPARALELCAVVALAPDRVIIELVETPDPPDLGAVATAVIRWRDAGFLVTIDDAGPPLPHWRALVDLPFTGVKLDGSLAQPGEAAHAMAGEIVTAAKRRNLFVVAEGIEDAAALERMRALGVDAVQGFLFCRPVPARALRLWAEAWRTLMGAA